MLCIKNHEEYNAPEYESFGIPGRIGHKLVIECPCGGLSYGHFVVDEGSTLSSGFAYMMRRLDYDYDTHILEDIVSGSTPKAAGLVEYIARHIRRGQVMTMLSAKHRLYKVQRDLAHASKGN